MPRHSFPTRRSSDLAIVIVVRKKRGLQKETEIASQVKGNGTEMNVE
jgi:hypothetical protein